MPTPSSSNQPYGAYATHQRADESVRETEARALLSCASRLEAARENGAKMEDYLQAIQHNQELWTIFQVCLCEPDNPLPRDLKLLLLNISRYVDKASFRALGHYEPDLLRGLISINRRIAAGLSAKPEGEAVTPSQGMTSSASGQVSPEHQPSGIPASIMTMV